MFRTSKLLLALVCILSVIGAISVPVAPAVAQSSTQVDIVGLGDSYTAGNGALVYEDHTCWRSGNTYVHQYRKQIQSAGGLASSKNHACMGAVNADIPGQIDQARDALAQAEVVVMTIGGNDAHFKDIVVKCFAAEAVSSIFASQCLDQIIESSRSVRDIAVQTQENLRRIRSAAPSAKILLVGYPYLIAENCEYVRDANRVREASLAADGYYGAIVQYLNNEVEGTPYVYVSMLEKFRGGEVCGSGEGLIRGHLDTLPVNFDKLLNGDLVGTRDELFAEWWHPNVEGHAAIAQALFNLGVHRSFMSSPAPASPAYVEPEPSTQTGGYANLPFACGTVVPFVSTYDSYGSFRHGLALDFPMPQQTKVYAPVTGVATVLSDPQGYGNYIDLKADDGTVFRLAHMQPGFSVANGQRVSKGTLLGYVGATGAATGPHLHFEQLSSGSQIAVNLAGPALNWGAKQDSGGYRQTTHSLRSENCRAVGGSSAIGGDGFADLMTFEFGNFRYGRSDGKDYSNWNVAFKNVTKPTDVAVCDFDGDGWDEYLSYEKQSTHPSWVMMADSKGGGDFAWKMIAAVHGHTDKITCGDWNGDGKADLILHNSQNEIIWGRSDGTKVDSWKIIATGIGTQTYWDMCDINGDAKQDLIAYESWGAQLMVGTRNGDLTMNWRRLLGGLYGMGGIACGNYSSYANDELVVWMPEDQGRYVLGRFGSSYGMVNWDPLSPVKFTKPANGELRAADITGDGYDEFIANESNAIRYGRFTAARGFSWNTFIDGISPKFMTFGDYI